MRVRKMFAVGHVLLVTRWLIFSSAYKSLQSITARYVSLLSSWSVAEHGTARPWPLWTVRIDMQSPQPTTWLQVGIWVSYFCREDSWSIYESLHSDPYHGYSAHAHWLRIREGSSASGNQQSNFYSISVPTILYSKAAGPTILTLRGKWYGQ